MTDALYAALATCLGTSIGCVVGYVQGRREERKAWAGLVRELYRNCRGGDEFKVEMVAKSQTIEKEGWR